ncbi:uncharacterized protein LOC143297005 [Babylonia areolata]|uniref:uncharacterized protein LOC143297005 n=1 Tax=Babylonia areolata TaxID=304850 RepID=UPI003FCEE704
MDKCISFYVTLVMAAVVIATVTSFGGDDNNMGGGFGDYFNRKYQNWLDKRGLGQPSGRFGGPLGSENRIFNWKSYLADGISKRQLNYGPRSFGNFQKYFTDGLQDWKSTYTGGIKKREAVKENTAAAAAAAGSDA